MLSGLIENLCYGMRPMAFVRQELNLNPVQKQIALRIFVLMVIFSIVAVSTRMPSIRATAFFVAMLLPQTLLTTRMALDSLKLMSKLLFVGILAGLATVVLWQDQGWFRFPFAIGVIVLMMFHARKSRLPNMVAIFFGTLALYDTSNPVDSVYSALWSMLILIGTVVVTNTLIAYVLWPQSSLNILKERIRQRLADTAILIEELATIPPDSLPQDRLQKARHTAGWVTETLKHLDDAIRDHPKYGARKAYWIETVMELDNLNSGLTDYQRLWLDENPAKPIAEGEWALLQTIRERFALAQDIFTTAGERRASDLPDRLPDLNHPSLSHILRRQYLAVQRLVNSLDDVYHGELIPPNPPPEKEAQSEYPDWLSGEYWDENKNILLWSLKVAIACMIVTLMVVSMDAGKVDTAILTTIIVADSTLGADVRKSIMRISGALLGAILGYLWLILGQPLADTVAGFLVTLLPFLGLCAWFGATSPRISYAGLQMGLAFTMTVFAEFEPGTYLGTGWYRILGILLGITVMGLIDYLLWPAKSVYMARLRIIQTLSQIRANLLKNPGPSDLNLELSVKTLRMMDSNLKDAVYFLDFARMEPGSSQPEARRQVSETSALIQAVTRLSKIIESRHRLILQRDIALGRLILGQVQGPIKIAYAEEYGAQAQALKTRVPMDHVLDLEGQLSRLVHRMEALEAFQNLTEHERHYLNALLDLERKHVLAMIDIRHQINESLQQPSAPPLPA